VHPKERLDACGIDRDEIAQVQLERASSFEAGAEQFRDLGGAEPARQGDDPPVTVPRDADPAIHEPPSLQHEDQAARHEAHALA
jgi:hypothetical protein